MIVYENYVWRLIATDLLLDLQLPQDLVWIDEVTWSPVNQNVVVSLTGALVVQESVQQKGRPLTLQGKDDMAWITRSTLEDLMAMRDSQGLVMQLQYIEFVDNAYTLNVLFDYSVMFRHYEPPALEADSVKGFDEFEPTNYFKVRSLKFMEVTPDMSAPCS